MSRIKQFIWWLRAMGARWLLRVAEVLDERAKKDKESWGSSMEYKRRYTNPDEAKRNRKSDAPPPQTGTE